MHSHIVALKNGSHFGNKTKEIIFHWTYWTKMFEFWMKFYCNVFLFLKALWLMSTGTGSSALVLNVIKFKLINNVTKK